LNQHNTTKQGYSKNIFHSIILTLEETARELQEENLIHVHTFSDTVYTHPESFFFTSSRNPEQIRSILKDPLFTEAVSVLKSAVFWDTMRCSLVKVNQHFGGTYHLHLQDTLFQ
jgi:hypothetical protein